VRLTKKEIEAIKEAFLEVFENGKIYLFGSRIDDSKRGGDIDLFIELDRELDIKEQMRLKSRFRLLLYDKIGEQKIDIIISKDKNKSIEQEALKTGVLL
jgi:predicted nucleotidyltransferase